MTIGAHERTYARKFKRLQRPLLTVYGIVHTVSVFFISCPYYGISCMCLCDNVTSITTDTNRCNPKAMRKVSSGTLLDNVVLLFHAVYHSSHFSALGATDGASDGFQRIHGPV